MVMMIASIAVGITERRLHVGRWIGGLLAVVHAAGELMMTVVRRLPVLRYHVRIWAIAGDALMMVVRVRLRLRLLGIVKAIW